MQLLWKIECVVCEPVTVWFHVSHHKQWTVQLLWPRLACGGSCPSCLPCGSQDMYTKPLGYDGVIHKVLLHYLVTQSSLHQKGHCWASSKAARLRSRHGPATLRVPAASLQIVAISVMSTKGCCSLWPLWAHFLGC